MQELEKKAYIYTVEAIGFARSLEKLCPDSDPIKEFKENSGKIYTLVADTHKAESNEKFADHLRQVRTIAYDLETKLPQIDVTDESLSATQEQLKQQLSEIIKKLDEILSKIIY